MSFKEFMDNKLNESYKMQNDLTDVDMEVIYKSLLKIVNEREPKINWYDDSQKDWVMIPIGDYAKKLITDYFDKNYKG
jgi:hypothetical protein